MGRRQYLVKTVSYCFLCLQPVTTITKTKSRTSACETNLETAPQKEEYVPRVFPFLNLYQYLELDLKEISKGILCEECAPSMESFSRDFLELELIQMKLLFRLSSILDRLKRANDLNENDPSLDALGLVQFEEVKKLRTKISEQCSRKLRNPKPRVNVTRLKLNELNSSSRTDAQEQEINIEVWRSPNYGTDETSNLSDAIKVEEVFLSGESSDDNNSTAHDFDFDCHGETADDGDRGGEEVVDCSTMQNYTPSFDLLRSAQIQGGMEVDEGTQTQDGFDRDPNVTAVVEELCQTLPIRKTPIPNPNDVEESMYSSNLETGSVTCNLCSKELKNYKTFQIHYKSTHQKLRYICQECGLKFKYQASFSRHHKNAHSGVRFQCDLCDKSFTLKDNLKKHQQTVHVERQFKCKFCGRTFRCQYARRDHHQKCSQRDDKLLANTQFPNDIKLPSETNMKFSD